MVVMSAHDRARDIGVFLRDWITEHVRPRGIEATLRYIAVPRRRQLDPGGEDWRRVLETTGQLPSPIGAPVHEVGLETPAAPGGSAY